MKIQCLKCRKTFVPNPSNIKIIGPDVETSCPHCYEVALSKFCKFSCLQNGEHMPQSASYARKAISLAQKVELRTSDYYNKKGLRHGGKKKVRNLRAGESAA